MHHFLSHLQLILGIKFGMNDFFIIVQLGKTNIDINNCNHSSENLNSVLANIAILDKNKRMSHTLEMCERYNAFI